MISLSEATRIARKKLDRFNYCNEYKDGYAFGYDDGSGTDDREIVVYKDDGHVCGHMTYILDKINGSSPATFIRREIDVYEEDRK